MKEFVSLKNVKSVSYFENRVYITLTISYFNNEVSSQYKQRIEGLDVEKQICAKEYYKETYVKIKNALTNKEDFVEVEL